MRQMLTPVIMLAGSILAVSTAQADDCTSIVKNIEQQQASVAAAEAAIEEHRAAYDFVGELSPVHELQEQLEHLQAQTAKLNALLEEIAKGKRAFDAPGDSAFERELRDVWQVLRTREAALSFQLDRLRRAHAFAQLQREIEAKKQKLEADITRAKQNGCD